MEIVNIKNFFYGLNHAQRGRGFITQKRQWWERDRGRSERKKSQINRIVIVSLRKLSGHCDRLVVSQSTQLKTQKGNFEHKNIGQKQ